MNYLKSFFQLVAMLCVCNFVTGQNQLTFSTSNLSTWSAKDNQGNTVTPVAVGSCFDPIVIEEICGLSYPKPKEASCGAAAIWGSGPIANSCTYAGATYTFTTTLTIPVGFRPSGVNFKLVADNEFTLSINGTQVLNQTGPIGSIWEREYTLQDSGYEWVDYHNGRRMQGTYTGVTDIKSLLRNGANTISVTVQNFSSGVCLNYAFLSMCGTVDLFLIKPNSIDASIESSISLYPNPASKRLVIESEDALIEGLGILNLSGERVTQINPKSVSNKLEIDVSSISRGYYLVEIKMVNGVLVHKHLAVR